MSDVMSTAYNEKFAWLHSHAISHVMHSSSVEINLAEYDVFLLTPPTCSLQVLSAAVPFKLQ
jgi:hypothetical protein